MTLPRTAAQVLSGHVTLEIRCIDRMLLTFRQPRLQYGQGIHGFFCHHRGNQFVSSALMLPMTDRFAADIRHYIDSRSLDLVRFAKGQSKDQIARRYLAGHDGGEQILFAGVAQEKTRIWRTRQRRDPVTGKRYPWLCQEPAMVNHWYFYGFDADFGPFYVNLAAMAEIGYAASRRLLDAECISHDPADGAAALEAITSPVISTTCTRIPGMRFPDPRVEALLGACCALALRPAGFTSRDLRHYLASQLGKTPKDMTSGQISYDLRRLRAHQIIERIPHSRAYQVTEDGLTVALFLTRLTQRVLIPGLAQLTSPGPPGGTRLRQADRLPRRPDRPRPARIPRRLTPPAAITRSNHGPACACPQPSHTPQLDSKFKIPAGKDNLPPDSCEAPTLLVTHCHTEFDESLSAHRHFENKSASIEVRYGLM